MILRPLSGVDISDFTIKLVVIIIKNHNNCVNKKDLRDAFRQTIYFHGCRELRSYYNICLMLMTIHIPDETILSLDKTNNIITI